MIYTGIFAGFRAARLDAQMEEGPEGTQPSSDPDGGDAYPCPEDDEFFYAPDAESQEEAIHRFMEVWNNRNTVAFHRLIDSCLHIYIVYCTIYYVYHGICHDIQLIYWFLQVSRSLWRPHCACCTVSLHTGPAAS